MITANDAKRFLKGFRKAVVRYESLNDEYEGHRTKLYSKPLVANYSGQGGSGVAGDKMGDDVAAFADYRDGLGKQAEAYAKVKDDVKRIVNAVWEVNERWGLSLHYRYIDWMSPAAAAYEMGYSDPSNERADHRRALEFVAITWPETIEEDLALLDSMCKPRDREH